MLNIGLYDQIYIDIDLVCSKNNKPYYGSQSGESESTIKPDTDIGSEIGTLDLEMVRGQSNEEQPGTEERLASGEIIRDEDMREEYVTLEGEGSDDAQIGESVNPSEVVEEQTDVGTEDPSDVHLEAGKESEQMSPPNIKYDF